MGAGREVEGQTSMLDALGLARKAADRAVDQVAAHADPETLDYWLGIVWLVARREPEFSTNAVFEYAKDRHDRMPMVEPRAMGAVMRRARTLGVIRPTDRYEPDRTPGAHGRPKKIWRSLLFQS